MVEKTSTEKQIRGLPWAPADKPGLLDHYTANWTEYQTAPEIVVFIPKD